VDGDSFQRNQEREASSPAGPARPWSSTWVSYYDRASRRRYRSGGYRRLRADAKRKRHLERFVVAVVGVGVLALVSVFYVILSH
jgi:hypothetical protein